MIIIIVILVSETFCLLCPQSGAWELRGAGVEWCQGERPRGPSLRSLLSVVLGLGLPVSALRLLVLCPRLTIFFPRFFPFLLKQECTLVPA